MPQQPRRVVFVSPGWPPAAAQNGIVTYVDHMSRGLEAAGVASRVVSSSALDLPDENVVHVASYAEKSEVDRIVRGIVRRFSPLYAHELVRRDDLVGALRRVQREWPFDLVEIEESFGAAESLRTRLSVPTVVRLHGPWFLSRMALGIARDAAGAYRERNERRAICRAVAVSSPSLDVLDRVRKRYGVELPHAEVVPNPAPEVDTHERWRLEACDPNLILFVGRFDRHKGGDVMLDAFRRVVAAVPTAELVFVGPDRGLRGDDGRQYTMPEFLNERLPGDARARVRVTGPLNRVAVDELRRRALVTVVPSRYETFSMTTLEAIAHGSPLVTSGAGGISEIVRDGDTARFFESGSPEALAAVLIDVLRDPEAAAQLGERAARRCRTRYAREVVAREMLGFYERVRDRRASIVT
jgi:glycosyltransferase involved in cell wall biosynthesis